MLDNQKIHLALQIVPRKEGVNTYHLVDKAIAIIQSSGVKYMITPMETVMEGTFDELNSIAFQAQKAVIEAGAEEVLVYIKMHYRKSGDVTFEEKRIDR